MNNPALLFLHFVLVDVLWDVVRFPVWWFHRAFVSGALWWARQLADGEERLALVVLMKNLGRPMFGDYTKEGRAISFGVRLIQLAVSLVIFVLWFILVTLGWIAWILLLPGVVVFLLFLAVYG